MPNLSRLALRGLSVLPFALAAVPAIAQSPDELVVTSSGNAPHAVTRSIAVSYSDLSLADGGYARLSRRVADAADKVCADNGLWSAAGDLDYLRCRRNAVATAMAHMPVSPSAGN